MSRRNSAFEKDVEEVRSKVREVSESWISKQNEVKKDIYNYFGLEAKSRRNSRLSETREIIIDPTAFFIGAFGGAVVGLLADEITEAEENAASNESRLNRTIARIISFPMKSGIRMISGGCIYVAVDNLTLQAFDRRWPIVSGALTAVCFANGRNLPVLVGSVIGLAVFAHATDLMFDAVYN